MLNDINDQSKNTEVFEILHRRIKDDLREGKNVVYDATNLNRRRRTHFIHNELKGLGNYDKKEKIFSYSICNYSMYSYWYI